MASYDEDSTTMAVEALRSAFAARPDFQPQQLLLSSTSPAYEDKTNAAVVHAALGLDRDVFAADFCGAVRSGVGALRLALGSSQRSSVVLSDVRGGLPGSDDEALGGDGASAVLVGRDPDELLATLVSDASVTAEFLERWRTPGQYGSRTWEDRFGEHAYLPMAMEAFTTALETASMTETDVDHLAVVGLQERALRLAVGRLGVKPDAVVDTHRDAIGNSGPAMIGVALAAALRRAKAGETIVLLSLADGADALVFRATDAVSTASVPDVGALASAAANHVAYPRYLTWRGQLLREPPRRPDMIPPSAPPALRSAPWKFGFTGSQCAQCGTTHLPPQQVCIKCQSRDDMQARPMSEIAATLTTFTVDHLALSLDPPSVVGVVDFDGGGRYRCELTDCEPDHIAVGDRVEMTFRRVFTAAGIHNYVWKARPIREKI
ncbi:OB-fold domain-containing protein [Mycolicibacterium sp.]|uniref:OB-fold domain-containing protein n=1 Tax=Mycolicibacterium sp. TaxID=2320850 RepID=UPI003D0AEF90